MSGVPVIRSLRPLLLAALLASPAVQAAATDLQYAPTTSSGHDFNHAPIGQSFQALASQVKAGLYLADQNSYTDWLATRYPGQIAPGSYPNAVAKSLRVGVKLIEGEGLSGTVLDSRELVLNAPFMGYVAVDYAAAGIALTVGRMYTLLLTDVSGQAYPNGVTGWVVPAVHDYASGASQPPGAYAAGLPVLQNQLVFNDAGIGDNAFEVLDLVAGNGGNPPPPPPGCSGANAVIHTVEASYLTVNGGTAVSNRVWYPPRNAISFTGGTSRFAPGQRLNYSGSYYPSSGCQAGNMTVMPAPAPVLVSGTLPGGQVGVAYSASLSASGGSAPYRWLASGVPAGLVFNQGSLSGTPSTAGTSTVVIDTSDAAGTTARNSYQLTIAAATPADSGCSKPAGAKLVSGAGKISSVTKTYFMVGTSKINLASCSRIRYRGKDQQLQAGQTVSWDAYLVNGVQTAKDVTVP